MEGLVQVTLPPDLSHQMEQELTSGRYRSRDELIEVAVRQLLDESHSSERRAAALRRMSAAVDEAGLYAKGYVPGRE